VPKTAEEQAMSNLKKPSNLKSGAFSKKSSRQSDTKKESEVPGKLSKRTSKNFGEDQFSKTTKKPSIMSSGE
jgi:hypothetical protein